MIEFGIMRYVVDIRFIVNAQGSADEVCASLGEPLSQLKPFISDEAHLDVERTAVIAVKEIPLIPTESEPTDDTKYPKLTPGIEF